MTKCARALTVSSSTQSGSFPARKSGEQFRAKAGFSWQLCFVAGATVAVAVAVAIAVAVAVAVAVAAVVVVVVVVAASSK